MSDLGHNKGEFFNKAVLAANTTDLDPAVFGDFNNVGWISLDNGPYSMVATSEQLSNTPFAVEAAQTYYLTIHSSTQVISTVTYMSQIFNVVKESTSGEAPLTYYRTFKTDIADFLARGFKGENSIQNFAAINSVTGLSFDLTAGNSKNLLEFLLESGESLRLNDGTKLLDTSGTDVTTFLDEANDKFMFPSNFKTAGKLFCPYTVRVKISGTLPPPVEADAEYNIRLRRVVDDSVISVLRIIRVLSATLDEATVNFVTFVNSETDPFVLDGTYIDISSPAGTKTLTLTDVSILITGTF